MDLLLNTTWIRGEIIACLIFLSCSFLYLVTEGFMRVKNLWKILFPHGRKSVVSPAEISSTPIALSPETDALMVAPSKDDAQSSINTPRRAELNDLVKIIRTKIARGEITEARTRIIGGLSIDKWHKDLNYLLASLYERDHEYRKAELIYKDLILVHNTDPEIYMKLGFALSIQGKFEIAYEIYKKLLEQGDGHIEAAEMLANIAHELARHEAAAQYAKMFLKNHPRHADMLTVLSVSLIELGHKSEALEALEKLKNIDPYNPRVREMKDKLELELELAKTFVSPAPATHEVDDIENIPKISTQK
jgi:Tfp pilus assembly protein PilF